MCPVQEYQDWLEELKEVLWYVSKLKSSMNLSFERVVDLKIIRGLDYYTWTIFEANFKSDEGIWSICWWGRYKNLTWYIDPKKNDYCWVGGSIGISRILWKIFDEKENNKKTIYPESEKLWKQFWYADKKWIPYVVVYGWWEKEQGVYKIKDMNTWEEKLVKIEK